MITGLVQIPQGPKGLPIRSWVAIMTAANTQWWSTNVVARKNRSIPPNRPGWLHHSGVVILEVGMMFSNTVVPVGGDPIIDHGVIDVSRSVMMMIRSPFLGVAAVFAHMVRTRRMVAFAVVFVVACVDTVAVAAPPVKLHHDTSGCS